MGEFILEYWMGIAFAALTTAFIKLGNQFKKIKSNYTAVENGIVALLRVEIIKIYNDYIDEESMPIYAKENFFSLYNTYKALGGNGTIDNLKSEVCSWTTRRSDFRNEKE